MITWIKKEITHILPALIYFLCAFNFIHFTMSMIRSACVSYTGHYFSYLSMSIDALIMGKALIISDSLPFINAFPNRPLVYNIIWKFFIYAFFVFLLWTLDAMFHLVKEYKNLAIAWQKFQIELSTPIFIASLMWVWMLLAIYVICGELINAIGKDKILRLLFGI